MKKLKLKKTPKEQFSNISAVNYQTLSDEELLFISSGGCVRDKLIITCGELMGIACCAVSCYFIRIIIKNTEIKFSKTQWLVLLASVLAESIVGLIGGNKFLKHYGIEK